MQSSWQFIKHPLHGALDLVVDVTLSGLAVAAWWTGASPAAVALPAIIAVANLSYSAMTTYALGRRHLISFRAHLALDAVAGALLVAGGAALPESDLYRLAMLAMGVGILGAVVLTDPNVDPPAKTAET